MRDPMTHYLKAWPGPFAAVRRRDKTFELRRADRDFQVRDHLCLQEWDPATERYSGEEEHRVITYMVGPGEWGLPDDLCVLGMGDPGEAGEA